MRDFPSSSLTRQGVTYRHEKVNSDHQLESEELGQWLVANQFRFENLVESQARHDSGDHGKNVE